VAVANKLTATLTEGAVNNLHECNLFERRVVRSGGFLLSYLYGLEASTPDATDIRRAAVIGHVLIQFWQQREQSGDADATFALPMLWRSYWRALSWLMCKTNSQKHDTVIDQWRDINFYDEYDRAYESWQCICFHSNYDWFFSDYLCAWNGRPTENWQEVREEEVHNMVWLLSPDYGPLRAPAGTNPISQRQLRQVIAQWYLPRYDLVAAGRVHSHIACHQGRWVERVWGYIRPLSLPRLYAAIGAGYTATALQSDTWTILAELTTQQSPIGLPIGRVVTIIFGAITLIYLYGGIQRKTGIGFGRALKRAFLIWCPGQVAAVGIGLMLALLIAPIIQAEQNSQLLTIGYMYTMPGSYWKIMLPVNIFLVVLYAQIALFIGVFVQLLFDEKSTTSPLGAP
jgi:hypothetical protein